MFVDRVKTMYTSTIDTIDIVLYTQDTPQSLLIALLYIASANVRIHIQGTRHKQLLSQFDNLSIEYHDDSLNTIVTKLESTNTRLIVFSYQTNPSFDYNLCEIIYKGIPLIHNSLIPVGYTYTTTQEVLLYIRQVKALLSLNDLHNQYKVFLKSINPWSQKLLL